MAELRGVVLRAVSREDLEQIVQAMVRQAKAGDVAAAREVLDRALGKPTAIDLDSERVLTEKTFADLCSVLVEMTRRRFGDEANALFAEILGGTGGRLG